MEHVRESVVVFLRPSSSLHVYILPVHWLASSISSDDPHQRDEGAMIRHPIPITLLYGPLCGSNKRRRRRRWLVPANDNCDAPDRRTEIKTSSPPSAIQENIFVISAVWEACFRGLNYGINWTRFQKNNNRKTKRAMRRGPQSEKGEIGLISPQMEWKWLVIIISQTPDSLSTN